MKAQSARIDGDVYEGYGSVHRNGNDVFSVHGVLFNVY